MIKYDSDKDASLTELITRYTSDMDAELDTKVENEGGPRDKNGATNCTVPHPHSTIYKANEKREVKALNISTGRNIKVILTVGDLRENAGHSPHPKWTYSPCWYTDGGARVPKGVSNKYRGYQPIYNSTSTLFYEEKRRMGDKKGRTQRDPMTNPLKG